MTLDQLIEMEDALESIKRGESKQVFVDGVKEAHKTRYGQAWEDAQTFVKANGIDKALRIVRRDINTFTYCVNS